MRSNLDLGHKVGKVDPFALRGHPDREAHFGERAIDDVAQADQAAIEHRAGGAAHAHVAAFDRGDREHRGVEQIAQLVREMTEALTHGLGAFGRDQIIALAAELGDGVRDGIVQAAIERAKLLRLERRVAFDRKLGDRLTEIPVIMHDLVYGKSLLQQFLAVNGSSHTDFRAGGRFFRLWTVFCSYLLRLIGKLLELERADELLEKHGYSMLLDVARPRRAPPGDLLPATRDQRLTVRG